MSGAAGGPASSAEAAASHRTSLIDGFMPRWHFSERHGRLIEAPPDVVRSALEHWSPSTSVLWRLLLIVRGLGRTRGTLRQWAEATGFLRLAEDEAEVVYGVAGRFWALRERAAIAPLRTADDFRRFDDPASVVAVFNLRCEALAGGRTRLSTETRVRALGPGARRRFRLYWTLIRPFSGLLRRSMLRGIEVEAKSLQAR